MKDNQLKQYLSISTKLLMIYDHFSIKETLKSVKLTD